MNNNEVDWPEFVFEPLDGWLWVSLRVTLQVDGAALFYRRLRLRVFQLNLRVVRQPWKTQQIITFKSIFKRLFCGRGKPFICGVAGILFWTCGNVCPEFHSQGESLWLCASLRLRRMDFSGSPLSSTPAKLLTVDLYVFPFSFHWEVGGRAGPGKRTGSSWLTIWSPCVPTDWATGTI